MAIGGRVSQPLAEHLLVEHGIHLITKVRKNMRERLLVYTDKLLLRKRAIIEEVYLKDYQTVAEAVSGLGRYFRFYSQERPHQALGYQTPAQVYGQAA